MKRTVKMSCLLLSMVCVMSVFAGCNSSTPGATTKATIAASGTTAATTAAPSTAATTSKTPVKIEIWAQNYDSAVLKSMSEIVSLNNIAKKTRVEITWKHPAVGQESEQFNIMVASGNYSDVIIWQWGVYPGGLTKAISDKLVIPLNSYLDTDLPFFKAILDKNPEVKRQTLLDDGTLPFLPAIDLDLRRRAYLGFLVRQDWLTQGGLKAPTTIDEWYTVLKYFKNNDMNKNGKADEIPFVLEKGMQGLKMFEAAWGVKENASGNMPSFYVDASTKKIKYGPLEAGFKDYLTTMAKWYSEGLIDKEFASIDSKTRDSKVTGDVAGSTDGYTASFSNYIGLMKANVPAVDFVGVPYPIGPAGKSYGTDDNSFRNVAGYGIAISTSCKNVKAALKFFDYTFSDAGQEESTWGVLGDSYTNDGGVKKFTDKILHDPTKLTVNQAIAKYALPFRGWTKVYDFNAFAAVELIMPQAKAANETWYKADKTLLMPMLAYTGAEGTELANIMSEVNTLTVEKFVKYIMGVEPMSTYDQYVATLKTMKIEKAISITQTAYDRFMARK